MSLAADLPARPLTLDDVTRFAERDNTHRFELTEGNLVVMPPGTWRHQRSAVVLRFRLDGSRYVDSGTVSLDDLLAGEAPDLS
jgi:hypothetical protein